MKKALAFALAISMLFSLAACSQDAAAAEPAATAEAAPLAVPTAAATPAAGSLSAEYADILKSGTYYYSLTADIEGTDVTVTCAAADGMFYNSTGAQGESITALLRDGTGYAVLGSTGEVEEFDPAQQGLYIPDYSTLVFKDSAEADGELTETYTYSWKNSEGEGVGAIIFVLKDGKLIKMSTPQLASEGVQPVTVFSAQPPAELFEIPTVAGSSSPYAWLGYAELPQNNYFDIMASDVYYREYDLYALGNVSHIIDASNINNTYNNEGGDQISLILEGMLYSLNTSSKIYSQHDSTDVWPATLAREAECREKGINTTGKRFVTTGKGAVPLLCESGDAAEYEYYEFLAELPSQDGSQTQRDRIYFKDGDVYAINTLVTQGDHQAEMTEVITAVSPAPDPALFALPDDFSQYKSID